MDNSSANLELVRRPFEAKPYPAEKALCSNRDRMSNTSVIAYSDACEDPTWTTNVATVLANQHRFRPLKTQQIVKFNLA